MSADPKLYRQMQVPFASREEATKASTAFIEELAELRKKHRIRDITYIMMFGYDSDEGESDAILSGSIGDAGKAETMLAFALGQVQTQRQNHIGSLLKGKRAT
jgi:hypothetical protein